MRRHRKATAAAVAAFALVAGTASSASAYPQRVEDDHTVGTIYGPCEVAVVALAEPGLAVVNGRLTAIESVQCESLSVTPYYIDLSGSFSETSLDPLDVLYSGEPARRCEGQKSCYWSRSKAWFPPGDHYVTHDVIIDLTAQSGTSQRFTSYPGDCFVVASDTGRLKCHFRQRVTMPAPAP
jgi:hypothetical protein